MTSRIGLRSGWCALLLGLLLLPGCEPPAPPQTRESSPATIASRFDPTRCGSISGHVVLTGTIPKYPPIVAAIIQPGGGVIRMQYENPNTPLIDPLTGAVAGAVVYLEGIETQSSRPWDHPPVCVEIHDESIRIIQSDAGNSNIGFVRSGDEIEMVSKDSSLHMLSVRGAAFFSLAFPDPARPLRRKLTQPGLVELSSGAGKYWQRAYVWVSDHPYFALTDSAGRFSLPQVPAGDYRLICWHPNAKIAAADRDPNTGMICRYHFAEALQSTRPVSIHAGNTAQLECGLGP